MKHRTEYKGLSFLLVLVLLLTAFLPSSCADTEATLENGASVNGKMKSLAAGSLMEYWAESGDIRAIRMADALPDDFVPSVGNTVSTEDSGLPVYIFFDNRDGAGVMYFYTEADRIVMHPDSSCMFAGHKALTDISGVTDWDASRVEDMYAMFSNTSSLPDALALRHWDTSNVKYMNFMFSGATSLGYIDVSEWKTGNVVTMAAMFQVGTNYEGDGQLREILGIGNMDVSGVMDMTCMFYGAGQMTYYDISGWDVSSVASMNHMFSDNLKLRSLDLSRWDVSSVTTMLDMFDDCKALRTIGDVSHWNTSSLIDAGGWLNYCLSFIGDNDGNLDLSGWDTRNLKAAGEMFYYTKLRSVDLSGWTFDAVTNDRWEGAGKGIYYETGNDADFLKGFGRMFGKTPELNAVYVSQEGLDSFNAAVEREVNTGDMWAESKCEGFTVK